MKQYIVYANTWEDGYGALISVFGVFDSLEKANESIEYAKYKEDYLYEIKEIDLNSWKEICLGGYVC